MTTLTDTDVLRRARDILAAGPLSGTYAACGVYCPWCAIAMAKSALDRELGADWFDDGPLHGARVMLKAYREVDTSTLSQEGALEILDRILA